ncbi:hypothetical protein [Bacillus thuringiensis]|uniref:hypothetical protein n=1 Tax=Bacillus thuringiensis TaxID=1428 RepID=UPI003F5B331C
MRAWENHAMIQTTDEQYHNHAREPNRKRTAKYYPQISNQAKPSNPQISPLFPHFFAKPFKAFFPQIEPLHRAKPSKENKDNRKKETKRHTTKLM